MSSYPKSKPNQSNLGFGKFFTDHMFIMDYNEDKSWHDPRIIPYAPLPMDPATMVFHYGQAVFEGLKAYRTTEDKILLFRPENNMERLNLSNERMCIPQIDIAFSLKAIRTLVCIDKDWVPSLPGTTLYIRPFVISTDAFLGVHPSSTYKFIIILCPVGAYYPQGINPIKICVEGNYVRSVKGGTGFVKTAGNYAASLKAQKDVSKKGYIQVLWLDGIEKKYVEEVGAMNVFFVINDEIITPSLEGSILGGITRDSAITILKDMGFKVSERRLSINEIINAYSQGTLKEAFGTGTAAVISPIGELCVGENLIRINDNKIGRISQTLYDYITGLQFGNIDDKFGWTLPL